MTQYLVRDASGKIADKGYYTSYHAEQMARALNLNDATHYKMFYGVARFHVIGK